MQKKTDCDGCRYWSELVAQKLGLEPLEALCLNVDSPCYNKMVHAGCGCYDRGAPVDLPY